MTVISCDGMAKIKTKPVVYDKRRTTTAKKMMITSTLGFLQ